MIMATLADLLLAEAEVSETKKTVHAGASRLFSKKWMIPRSIGKLHKLMRKTLKIKKIQPELERPDCGDDRENYNATEKLQPEKDIDAANDCHEKVEAEKTSEALVLLNVYDLVSVNNYTYWLGFGIFHSAIQVHGKEYSFGPQYEFPNSTGVWEVEPRRCPGFTYRRSLVLGRINMSHSEFRTFLEDMSSEYCGDSYDLISRNCNHFTDDASRRSTGRRIPGWVNRLARVGASCSCLLPKSLQANGSSRCFSSLNESLWTESPDYARHSGASEIYCSRSLKLTAEDHDISTSRTAFRRTLSLPDHKRLGSLLSDSSRDNLFSGLSFRTEPESNIPEDQLMSKNELVLHDFPMIDSPEKSLHRSDADLITEGRSSSVGGGIKGLDEAGSRNGFEDSVEFTRKEDITFHGAEIATRNEAADDLFKARPVRQGCRFRFRFYAHLYRTMRSIVSNTQFLLHKALRRIKDEDENVRARNEASNNLLEARYG